MGLSGTPPIKNRTGYWKKIQLLRQVLKYLKRNRTTVDGPIFLRENKDPLNE